MTHTHRCDEGPQAETRRRLLRPAAPDHAFGLDWDGLILAARLHTPDPLDRYEVVLRAEVGQGTCPDGDCASFMTVGLLDDVIEGAARIEHVDADLVEIPSLFLVVDNPPAIGLGSRTGASTSSRWCSPNRAHPFDDEVLRTMVRNIYEGRRRPPPEGSDVPTWLRHVCERGLATDPSQRWPSMEALLAALDEGTVG